jgi:hypothetical protein
MRDKVIKRAQKKSGEFSFTAFLFYDFNVIDGEGFGLAIFRIDCDLGFVKLTFIPESFSLLTKSTKCFLAILKTPFYYPTQYYCTLKSG